jgi:Protein of unknown function (DUF3726)
MILSLNEIEATILKAARGAGLEWGLAEEAAHAARTLAGAGIPFEAAFLHLFETAPWRADLVLEPNAIHPRKAVARLCPIRVGACLSDLADLLPLRVKRMLCPLLLLPFAARLERPIAFAANGVTLRLRGRDIAPLADETLRCLGEPAEIVELTASSTTAPTSTGVPPRQGGVAIDMVVWPKLQAFEALTYVPASRRSRLLGAGAGRIDND